MERNQKWPFTACKLGGNPFTTEPSTGMIKGVKVGETQICLRVFYVGFYLGVTKVVESFIELFPDEIDLGGDFIFFFTRIWERFSFWRAYFSKGLVQPPTRNRIGHQQIHLGICFAGIHFCYFFGLGEVNIFGPLLWAWWPTPIWILNEQIGQPGYK